MFVHLGQGRVVNEKDIIGIFDIESSTVVSNTRIFLNKAEKSGIVTNVSLEMPKSFIVCSDKLKRNRVYISQISSSVLSRRRDLTDILGLKK
ncbi:MAG: DUF370 domain-containing protein [Clostridia bacterium]|nr:DUF370 domain-containing protein [Clostridia bacterium]